MEDSDEEPDIYDIDVIAWDYGLSPLHLAILNGHLHIVELLVSEYGADVLLPVKLTQPDHASPRGAILTLVLALSLPAERAREMIKLLLELGATSSQADMHHITALHYVVSEDSRDALDILLSEDRPAALSIISNVASNQQWGRVTSPLLTAVEKCYPEMASKLLEAGAAVSIAFDEWVKTYLEKHPWAKSWNNETIMVYYHREIQQPIVDAAIQEMTTTVEQLVQKGADVQSLESNAYNVIQHPENGRHTVAETLLDIVQRKLKSLRDYKGPDSGPIEPPKLREQDFYTKDIKEGTYRYWSAVQDYKVQLANNQQQHKQYQKQLKEQTPVTPGAEEKKKAVEKMRAEFERLEKILLEAGAKTFAELYPDLPKPDTGVVKPFRRAPLTGQQPAGSEYATRLTFNVPGLTLAAMEGYLKLFEAAWSNDLETVKALTLTQWESSAPNVPVGAPIQIQQTARSGPNMQPPLQIAVTDSNSFSPYSIAILRGHYDLARKIADICLTQCQGYEDADSSRRWRMLQSDSEDEYYSDVEEQEHELPIYSELVSDKYTVDNLGQVSNIVKSSVRPIQMMQWVCKPGRFNDAERDTSDSLVGYAIRTNNQGLFKFMMKHLFEQQIRSAIHDDDPKIYNIPSSDFLDAIRYGRTEMLAYMIKTTGIGIPLNELVKKSGIEIKAKSKYYQGLTVGGKKRADWAQAPGTTVQVVEEKIPPLLQAARAGSIESVEWFLSSAPMRRYKEFAEKNKDDKRIKVLEQSGKGFERTIETWLNAESECYPIPFYIYSSNRLTLDKGEILLHAAILYNPPAKDKEASAKYMELIKHIVSLSPDCLEQQSPDGFTPLHVAVYIQRPEVISYLISIGANQRHRDTLGRNLLHALVARRSGGVNTDAKKLRSLIALLDKDAVKEMLLERCSNHPGSLTPLAYWMAQNNGNYKKTDVIRVLSEYSTGEDLTMLNGEGDLPLHVVRTFFLPQHFELSNRANPQQAIRQGLSAIPKFLLTLNPTLLHRENTTGRTPLEMARDTYLSSRVESPPSVFSRTRYYYNPAQFSDTRSVINRQPSSFVLRNPEEGENDSKALTNQICEEFAKTLAKDGNTNLKKRKLASLFEANEVARRLADNKNRSFTRGRPHYNRRQARILNGRVEASSHVDLVNTWMAAY